MTGGKATDRMMGSMNTNRIMDKTSGTSRWGKHCALSSSNTRIFLVRHGQPVQHSGKIFLGQSDIPLSARGRGEAETAGDRLLALGARPKRIYASDLLRAKETADIIAGKLGDVPVITDILFREMAMGTWDGELVEDIKAKFPEEFEKRGDDLRNYRTPGGENFYDLRSRVTREFHRIFKEDFRNAMPDAAQGSDPGDPGDTNGGNGETYDGSGDIGDSSGGGSSSSPGGSSSGPGGSSSGPGDPSSDPGDLVIVAHFGVLVTLTEELQAGEPDPEAIHNFATGSVTVFDVPDWLLARGQP